MEELNITYTLEFDEQALKDIQLLKKSEKQAPAWFDSQKARQVA